MVELVPERPLDLSGSSLKNNLKADVYILSVIQKPSIDKYGAATGGNRTCMDNDMAKLRTQMVNTDWGG